MELKRHKEASLPCANSDRKDISAQICADRKVDRSYDTHSDRAAFQSEISVSPAIRLRPHHLLCAQGYEGIGYDGKFKAHMDEVVHRLRTEKHTPVTLVFSTDELCSACPNQLGEDHCRTNEKVKTFDRRTTECFHLEEKTYIYQDVVDKIRQTATPEIMDYICGDCSWYPASACRERVLGSMKPLSDFFIG